MITILKLLWTFIKIGAFSFGGGYVMIPLIQREVVETYHWISESMFLDMIAISQSTPGPIAVNTATFAGFQVAGFWGSMTATIGVTCVSFVLVVILSHKMNALKDNQKVNRFFYGLRPAVVAMILTVAIKLGKVAMQDIYAIIIGGAVLIAIQKFRVHPLICILGSGIIGIVLYA